MAAPWRRLVWDLTGLKKTKQELREGAFGRGDHLLQHSEVSERRLVRAQRTWSSGWSWAPARE